MERYESYNPRILPPSSLLPKQKLPWAPLEFGAAVLLSVLTARYGSNKLLRTCGYLGSGALAVHGLALSLADLPLFKGLVIERSERGVKVTATPDVLRSAGLSLTDEQRALYGHVMGEREITDTIVYTPFSVKSSEEVTLPGPEFRADLIGAKDTLVKESDCGEKLGSFLILGKGYRSDASWPLPPPNFAQGGPEDLFRCEYADCSASRSQEICLYRFSEEHKL